MDFPDVVPEALRHIQKLWLPDCNSQQLGLMKELTEEFVFFEVDKWGNVRHQKLSPIKELQIIERISHYFRQSENDQKMATFQILFPKGSTIVEKRLAIFGKLLSLVIATENANVLTYIGTWMQICGCLSDNSAFVAKSVIREHLKPTVISDRMKKLPIISPLFCASLIAAITNLYMTSCPPDHIINVILDWINSNPKMCFSAYKMNIPNTFNFTGPQTPIPGLMFWCILSPLHKECAEPDGKWDMTDKTFSHLHLALMECMLKFNESHNTWCEALAVTSIKVVAETLDKMKCLSKERVNTALDRLAQCLEISLTSKCLHASNEQLGKLFLQCIDLPYNRPLKIVVEKWSAVLETGSIACKD